MACHDKQLVRMLEVMLEERYGAGSPGRQHFQTWAIALLERQKMLAFGHSTTMTPSNALREVYRGLLDHIATPHFDIYLGT